MRVARMLRTFANSRPYDGRRCRAAGAIRSGGAVGHGSAGRRTVGGVSARVGAAPSATMGSMTVVAQRPLLRVGQPSPGPERPLALGALIATGWVLIAGLTVSLALAVASWFAA